MGRDEHSPPGHQLWQLIAAFTFGVVFVVVILAIVLWVPEPSAFQAFAFRVVLALAAAGIGAVVPGFIVARIGNVVRAGGAIALFVNCLLVQSCRACGEVGD